MNLVKHTIKLWFVIQAVSGTPLSNHFFCHGTGPETRCNRCDKICVVDDPRADLLCPRTFELDFEVTSDGSVRTFFYCTPPAWFVTWPQLDISAEQSQACITIDETTFPWDPEKAFGGM